MDTFEIKTLTIIKIILIVLSFVVLYSIRGILAYVIFALIISSAIIPLINFLEQKRIPRVLGVILTYLVIISFFILIIWFSLPPFVNQIQGMTSSLPIWLNNLQNTIQKYKDLNLPHQVIQGIEGAISDLIAKIVETPPKIFNLFTRVSGVIFSLIFLIVLSAYLSFEKNIDKRFAKFVFPNFKKKQEYIFLFWQRTQKIIGRWLQGYIISAIIVGFLVWVSFSILGIEYSAVIAVIAGFCEIVPLFGPIFALMVGLILTLFQDLHLVFWVFLIFLIIQQVDNYFILPFIMKNRVRLNPLITLIAIFIGGNVGGLLGMIAAVPLCAVLIEWWRIYQMEFSK